MTSAVNTVPPLALRSLWEDAAFIPYETVIVDEAQDVTPVGLRLPIQMAGRDAKRVTTFADAAQSIYRAGFRRKQLAECVGQPPSIAIEMLGGPVSAAV